MTALRSSEIHGIVSYARAFLVVALLTGATAVSASSDFNGDGYDDLAIGVTEEAFGVTGAGAVNVIYGSPTGLQANGVTVPDDQFWTQDSAGVTTGGPDNACETQDGFGSALSTGDYNGDGFDDLAIGVPGENIGTVADAGAVNVLYGSASGLQANGVGGPDDQFWHQDVAGILGTAETSDHFGSALCSGDFNGDTYDDLAIGVPGEDGFEGSVNVIYGSPGGLQTLSDQTWEQGLDVEDARETGDEFGFSLTCADFDGDDIDDLAVGVPFEEINGDAAAGAVNVIYGSSSGLQATGTGGPDDQFWHQDLADVTDIADAGNEFGFSLTSSDLNDDGYADIAIGVPYESNGVIADTGAVNVIYGSSDGLQATGSGGPDDQFWHQGFTDVEDDTEFGDKLGYAVASCDFNGDGYADLAMGVPYEDFSDPDTGAVNVLYGSSDGLTTGGVVGGITIPNDQLWSQGNSTDSVSDTREGLDRFGYAVGCGDFNGGGQYDLVVGVPGEQLPVGGIDQIDAGAVNVIYGSARLGLQSTGKGGPDDQFFHQDTVGIKDSVEQGDFFGACLAH